MAFALLGALVFQAGQAQAALPELPRVFLDTSYAPPAGNTITVNAGGNLQAAINNAQPGDTIVLQAGATFTGPFTLPNKGTSTQWIYIRSSAYGSLPAPGNRVSPGNASSMATIAGSGSPVVAIQTQAGAHHYRFVGIEFKPVPGLFTTGLIRLGGGETSLSALPNNIVIDRCYIHGDPTIGGRRGIALNSASTAVIDSYLSDWKEAGSDSQAIASWNSPGPVKLANNHLEGAGENVMIGGADPSIPSLVPSDIEIRGNRFYKPVAWRGQGWIVKNLFELKNARRVLMEGNILENDWAAAQDFAINIKSSNQDGTAPWSVTEDYSFRNNIVRNAPSAIKLCGYACDGITTGRGKRYLIQNNLFHNIDGAVWGGSGNFLQTTNSTPDLVVDHNTVIHTGSTFSGGDGGEGSNTGFQFTNNIVQRGPSGFKGSGAGEGVGTLNAFFPGYVFTKNAIVGASAAAYPAGSYFPPAYSSVGFTNFSGGDYRLSTTSPYRGAATDGKDVGADIDAITTATACALDGQCSATQDSTPPVLSAVGATSVTASQAVIAWNTSEPADSQVEYGLTTSYGSATGINAVKATSHSMSLGNLAAATTYHYRVKSRDAAGNLATSANFTFVTAAAADTKAPSISGVSSPVVTSTSATINWTTDEAADSQVEYGLTTAYGTSTTLDGARVTSHAQHLNNLVAGKAYHYRVKSRDAAGNLATSGNFTFTTPGAGDTAAPTAPSGLALRDIRRTRMTLGWNASADNVGVAGYRIDASTSSSFSSFVSSYQDRNVGNATSFIVTGLARQTVYYFRVRAYDAAGNVSASSVSVWGHTN